MPLIPVAIPLISVLTAVGRVLLRRIGRARRARGADPGILHPGRDLVAGGRDVEEIVGRLGADPADHHEGDEHRQREERENHDRCGSGPPDVVPSEPVHDGLRDAGEQEGDDDGAGDLGRRAEQPDDAGKNEEGAGEQPGGDAEVAQPARSREDARELRQLGLVELDHLVVPRSLRLRVAPPSASPLPACGTAPSRPSHSGNPAPVSADVEPESSHDAPSWCRECPKRRDRARRNHLRGSIGIILFGGSSDRVAASRRSSAGRRNVVAAASTGSAEAAGQARGRG